MKKLLYSECIFLMEAEAEKLRGNDSTKEMKEQIAQPVDGETTSSSAR